MSKEECESWIRLALQRMPVVVREAEGGDSPTRLCSDWIDRCRAENPGDYKVIKFSNVRNNRIHLSRIQWKLGYRVRL
jgi:hypothetical protein